MPKTMAEFWSGKINGKRESDQRKIALLQEAVCKCYYGLGMRAEKKNTFEDTVKLVMQKIKGPAENPAE